MNDESHFNPYASPDAEVRHVRTRVTFDPLPCPMCESRDIQPTPYDAWRGRRAAKAIQDVTCQDCSCNYDGETGVVYPPKKNPIVWFLLVVLLFVLYLVGYIGFIISMA